MDSSAGVPDAYEWKRNVVGAIGVALLLTTGVAVLANGKSDPIPAETTIWFDALGLTHFTESSPMGKRAPWGDDVRAG